MNIFFQLRFITFLVLVLYFQSIDKQDLALVNLYYKIY